MEDPAWVDDRVHIPNGSEPRKQVSMCATNNRVRAIYARPFSWKERTCPPNLIVAASLPGVEKKRNQSMTVSCSEICECFISSWFLLRTLTSLSHPATQSSEGPDPATISHRRLPSVPTAIDLIELLTTAPIVATGVVANTYTGRYLPSTYLSIGPSVMQIVIRFGTLSL